jgi:hypothetical protein
MQLTQELIKKIIEFVKKEPRTVQDISHLIKKSWVTTEKYVQEIKRTTGQINIKVFRKGTKGALKLVYYSIEEAIVSDSLKEDLFHNIIASKRKKDFDPLEIYQHVKKENKKSYLETIRGAFSPYVKFLSQTKHTLLIFSGNLSFISEKHTGKNMLKLFEELLKNKVTIKIVCRLNLATIKNIELLKPLINRYPKLIEIKNKYHPLRGCIIDNKLVRLYSEENLEDYKEGELDKNIVIAYDIFEQEWINWLENVFWHLYRTSIDYTQRLNEINNIGK